jgi:hypothetical protein
MIRDEILGIAHQAIEGLASSLLLAPQLQHIAETASPVGADVAERLARMAEA